MALCENSTNFAAKPRMTDGRSECLFECWSTFSGIETSFFRQTVWYRNYLVLRCHELHPTGHPICALLHGIFTSACVINGIFDVIGIEKCWKWNWILSQNQVIQFVCSHLEKFSHAPQCVFRLVSTLTMYCSYRYWNAFEKCRLFGQINKFPSTFATICLNPAMAFWFWVSTERNQLRLRVRRCCFRRIRNRRYPLLHSPIQSMKREKKYDVFR